MPDKDKNLQLNSNKWRGNFIDDLDEDELKCALKDALGLLNDIVASRDSWRDLYLSRMVYKRKSLFRRIFRNAG